MPRPLKAQVWVLVRSITYSCHILFGKTRPRTSLDLGGDLPNQALPPEGRAHACMSNESPVFLLVTVRQAGHLFEA